MKKLCLTLLLILILGCMNKTDEKGFYIEGNKKGINKFTKAEYDKDGYNINGYNKFGYNKEGFKSDGYDKFGYDKDGYDKDGFNKLSINKETGTQYNKDGYNRIGYNKEGYDKNGFDRNGYDKDGYNKNGYNKDGYDRSGFNLDNFNKNGVHKITKNKYNQEGYNKDGLHKDTNTKYNLDLKDKNGNKLNSLLYIGDFVDEFNEKTNEQFVGYKGKIISSKYGKSSEKTILMLITKDEIEFRLTPYVYLNSDGKVDCSIKIGEKIIKTKLWASKDSAYIFRKNNPKEYSKLIKEMENEGLKGSRQENAE